MVFRSYGAPTVVFNIIDVRGGVQVCVCGRHRPGPVREDCIRHAIARFAVYLSFINCSLELSAHFYSQ